LHGGLYENDQITEPYHRPAWVDYKWLNMGSSTWRGWTWWRKGDHHAVSGQITGGSHFSAGQPYAGGLQISRRGGRGFRGGRRHFGWGRHFGRGFYGRGFGRYGYGWGLGGLGHGRNNSPYYSPYYRGYGGYGGYGGFLY